MLDYIYKKNYIFYINRTIRIYTQMSGSKYSFGHNSYACHKFFVELWVMQFFIRNSAVKHDSLKNKLK